MFPVFVSSLPAQAAPHHGGPVGRHGHPGGPGGGPGGGQGGGQGGGAGSGATGFQRAQQTLEHQIIARQVQLALLGNNVADAPNVTASDRTALAAIITSEQTDLATDAANATAATTVAELLTVAQAVIGDERVYAVVTGQVNLVLSADNFTVVEAGFTNLVTELTPLVTELGDTHASNLLADVTSEVVAGTSLTTGVSAEALALAPSGYPGNKSEIQTWTYQLRQVGRDLDRARDDVQRIEQMALSVHFLPGPLVAGSTTTTVAATTTTTVAATTTTTAAPTTTTTAATTTTSS